MINLDRYISFLEKHKLTQQQLLLLMCLNQKRVDLLKRYKALFPTEDGSLIGTRLLEELIDKGWIQRIGEGVNSDNYKITEKFIKLFIDKRDAGVEFMTAYPKFLQKDGVRYPLTGIDEEEFIELYAKRIENSVDEHIEVMKDLKYAIDNNLIQMKLEKFVGSKQWLAIRAERQLVTTAIEGGQGVRRRL